jgi:cytidylate kinase
LAIITISYQHGSRGEVIGREVAAQLGFTLITQERVSELIRERYRLDYSLKGEIDKTPRDKKSGKLLVGLISAVLTDLAVLNHILVLECGGQFIFRAFPNALRVRVLAPREVRAQNIMQESGVSREQALRTMDEQDRRNERFLRSSFRRSVDMPERYDLSINTEGFTVGAVVKLILSAARLKKVRAYGMVADDTVERMQLHNQVRLQKALTNLSIKSTHSLAQFANSSELLFARLLDFYGIQWEYEPRTFPLRRDERGNILEAFSPDFYLPGSDLYVELTTMKQSLVTKKNRKVRLLREIYPEIQIRLLYQKDFEDLIFKYKGPKDSHKIL